MTRSLTEQKVLDKLEIEDFRHLTKDKVITMASMLDRMDPDVAKKALDQFPQFADTMKELVQDFQKTMENGLKANDESTKSCHASCDAIIAALLRELDCPELTFEQKLEVVNQLKELQQMKNDLDSRNKKFISTMQTLGVVAVTVVAGVLVTSLGGNTKLDWKDVPKISAH